MNNDPQKLKNNFIEELERAQNGEKNSIPFIVNQLPTKPPVAIGEKFQVISIGGTNIKEGLFEKDKNGILQLLESHELNNRKAFTSKADVLNLIRDHYKNTSFLGINFAFPMNPTFESGILDGKVIGAGKHDKFDDLIGSALGKEVSEYLEAETNQQVQVSAANDTICLIMAGNTRYDRSSLGAGIVGTGFNIAFFTDSEHAVNTQAASFDKYDISETGKKLMNELGTSSLGIEKEISGAFLFRHFNYTAGISQKIESTEEMDVIARDESHPDNAIAKSLFMHSAQLVAAQIAGILEFQQKDLYFVMEGSLFWKAWNYKEMVEEWVAKLSPKYKADFFEVEDSELYGAAKLIA